MSQLRKHALVADGARTKIQQAGFPDTVNSKAVFLRLFDKFRARKVIA